MCATGLASVAGLAAWAQVAIDDAHRRLTNRSDLQFELTPWERPEIDIPPERRPRNSGIGEGLDAIFGTIFWIAIGAVVIGILYFIAVEVARTRFGYGKKKDQDPDQVDFYRPSAETARILMDEADRLAAEGRYAEAVHALLYRSIQDIQNTRPRDVAKSLTSREIAKLPILTEQARNAFGKIGAVVERSFFGHDTVFIDDYQDCRAAYERFALSGNWTKAAS